MVVRLEGGSSRSRQLAHVWEISDSTVRKDPSPSRDARCATFKLGWWDPSAGDWGAIGMSWIADALLSCMTQEVWNGIDCTHPGRRRATAHELHPSLPTLAGSWQLFRLQRRL